MRLDHLLSMENVLWVKRRRSIVYEDERQSFHGVLFNFQGSRILEKSFEGQKSRRSEVGVTNAEGPPVPIPNTEVKLCSGENTLRETAREDSSMPTQVKGTGKTVPKA